MTRQEITQALEQNNYSIPYDPRFEAAILRQISLMEKTGSTDLVSFKYNAYDTSRFVLLTKNDIIRAKQNKMYTDIYLEPESIKRFKMKDRFFSVRSGIKVTDEKLKFRGFYRCHNSHIINLSKVLEFRIKKHEMKVEMLNGDIVPVSRSKKQQLLRILKK